MKKRAILTLALLTFAAGCSFKSPAEGLDFKAPAGWKSTPSIMGMQMWMKGGNTPGEGEVLMLVNHVGGRVKSLNDFDMRTVPTGGGGRVTSEQPIRICGNQPAKYFTMTGESKGKPMTSEVVVTEYPPSNLYVSMYMRPKGASADPQAETALRSLCLKPANG